MGGQIESIVVADWDNPIVQHAVNRAFMQLNGEWDASKDDSRLRLLQLVREKLPNAVVVYDPAEGKVPRVHIRSQGGS